MFIDSYLYYCACALVLLCLCFHTCVHTTTELAYAKTLVTFYKQNMSRRLDYSKLYEAMQRSEEKRQQLLLVKMSDNAAKLKNYFSGVSFVVNNKHKLSKFPIIWVKFHIVPEQYRHKFTLESRDNEYAIFMSPSRSHDNDKKTYKFVTLSKCRCVILQIFVFYSFEELIENFFRIKNIIEKPYYDYLKYITPLHVLISEWADARKHRREELATRCHGSDLLHVFRLLPRAVLAEVLGQTVPSIKCLP